MTTGVARPVIERASTTDLMELASETAGAAMQVAAVLVLNAGPDLTLSTIRKAIADRIQAVPRLRQRLVRAPWGGGRPYWIDDPRFDVDRHVHAVTCPPPGDERALLDLAAGVVTTRLPLDRPLWSATFVSGLTASRRAVIVTFHHVLADGIGGLAVLANLVDGAERVDSVGAVNSVNPVDIVNPVDTVDVVDGVEGAVPTSAERRAQPLPSRRDLYAEAWRTRLRAAAHLPAGVRMLRDALGELKPGATSRAARCSLNQPTGQRRAFAVVRTDLAAIRTVGHVHQATVNDVVLTAVTGALHRLLRDRGEQVDRLVISIPVSSRRSPARASSATGSASYRWSCPPPATRSSACPLSPRSPGPARRRRQPRPRLCWHRRFARWPGSASCAGTSTGSTWSTRS